MERTLILSIFAVTVFAGEGTSAWREPPQVSIAVALYNYAAIPADDLRLVKQQVLRILGDAGIDMVFLDCPLSAAELNRYPDCSLGSHPVELVLRIHPGLPPRNLVRLSGVNYFFRSTTI